MRKRETDREERDRREENRDKKMRLKLREGDK